MEKEDIFKFGDFINGDKFSDLQKMKSELVKEGLFSDEDHYEEDEDDDIHLQHRNLSFDEDEEINQELNPYNVPSSEIDDDDDDDDDDFGFESPFCKPCEGTGCEECDGSGMKRNSVVNNEYKDRSMYDPYYDEQGGLDDFDSYRKSNYGRDTKNRLDLNSLDENKGRRFFNSYQKKSGGRPSTVRRRK